MNRLGTLDLISKQLQAANAAVILAVSGWYALVLPALPDRIPVHWGPTGPNRWGSPHEMWLFAGVMLMNTAIVWGCAFFVARGKERDISKAPEAVRLAARTALDDQKVLGVRVTEWIFLIINVGMAAFWVVAVEAARTGDVSLVNRGVMALMTLMAVAIIGPIAFGLRRGLHNQKKIRDLLPADPEDGWVAGGMIYYAPEDERLWVTKRIGIGWTLNFARPASWWIMAGALGIPIIVAIVVLVRAT